MTEEEKANAVRLFVEYLKQSQSPQIIETDKYTIGILPSGNSFTISVEIHN